MGQLSREDLALAWMPREGSQGGQGPCNLEPCEDRKPDRQGVRPPCWSTGCSHYVAPVRAPQSQLP